MSGIYYTLILYTLQIYIYKTRETYQFDCIKKENDIYIYTHSIQTGLCEI